MLFHGELAEIPEILLESEMQQRNADEKDGGVCAAVVDTRTIRTVAKLA